MVFLFAPAMARCFHLCPHSHSLTSADDARRNPILNLQPTKMIGLAQYARLLLHPDMLVVDNGPEGRSRASHTLVFSVDSRAGGEQLE